MFIYFLFLCLLESPYAKYRKSGILINHDSRKIIICFVVAGCNDQGVYFYIRPVPITYTRDAYTKYIRPCLYFSTW